MVKLGVGRYQEEPVTRKISPARIHKQLEKVQSERQEALRRKEMERERGLDALINIMFRRILKMRADGEEIVIPLARGKFWKGEFVQPDPDYREKMEECLKDSGWIVHREKDLLGRRFWRLEADEDQLALELFEIGSETEEETRTPGNPPKSYASSVSPASSIGGATGIWGH